MSTKNPYERTNQSNFKEVLEQLFSEHVKENSFPLTEEQIKAPFNNFSEDDYQLHKDHDEELKWLKESMEKSVEFYLNKNFDQHKILHHEIESYCEATEAYHLFLGYDSLLIE